MNSAVLCPGPWTQFGLDAHPVVTMASLAAVRALSLIRFLRRPLVAIGFDFVSYYAIVFGHAVKYKTQAPVVPCSLASRSRSEPGRDWAPSGRRSVYGKQSAGPHI